MTDIVTATQRSKMMAGIRGKNTKPELQIRSQLHKQGFRFRIHANLPGKPDLVFKQYRAIIFVHGCFWHGHRCHLFKWPQTRPEFWKNKINRNVKNDQQVLKKLSDMGWRTCIVWECSLKGKGRLKMEDVISTLSSWLKSDEQMLEVSA